MIVNQAFEPGYEGRMECDGKVVTRWREKEGDQWVRKERIVDFEPYVYVPSEEPITIRAYDGTKNTSYAHLLAEEKYLKMGRQYNGPSMVDRVEKTSQRSADGTRLSKVYLRQPWMTRKFARIVKPTFEADVPYEDRYLIDSVEEIKLYPMRNLFIDLEALQYHVDDGPETISNNPRARQMINVIGAYDSYTKTYIQWCCHDSYDLTVKNTKHDGVNTLVHYFSNEKEMLESFVNYVDAIDPDCILAWGMAFYDLPTLFWRLEELGIGADSLSPSSIGKHRHIVPPSKWFKGATQYRWRAQPITGRVVIALDVLFERAYKDSKSANLPSNKLDVVGEKLFGRGKTEFRPDFYDADYDEFMDDYLYYNFRDVQLMVEIEEKYNLINGQQNLQELAVCEYSATLTGSAIARTFFMREADFIQKTGWQDYDEDEELQGAIIMDPEAMGTIGAHRNVVILDFAGLYPSMMVAYNTSWETKVKPGEESDDDIIGDGCRFRRSPMGVLPKCVIKLDRLRDEYKALRQQAAEEHGKSSDEYRKWDDAQKTVKRLRATFYGLMGFGRKGYAWGDIDIARTITYGGRTNLMRIQDECERLGYPVIYGHTDSIFVKLGDDKTVEECAEIATMLGERLTKICQEALQSDAVDVEPELIMDRFYLPRRNKYAGRIVWQPGTGATPFDIGNAPVDSRIKMQGLEAKHTNTAPVGRKIQIDCLKMIWDDKPASEVFGYAKQLVQSVIDGDVPVEDLIAGGRLGKWLTNFDRSLTPRDEDGKRAKQHHPLCDSKGTFEWTDRQGKKRLCKCNVWRGAERHYLAGATNRDAKPGADEDDACYTNLTAREKAVAWHNVVLSDDLFAKMDKGDTYSVIYIKDGPTWFPVGGLVAFQDLAQLKGYEIDYRKIAEKNLVDKVDHIMHGLGLSNQDLLPAESQFANRRLSMEDFQ